MMGTTLEFSNPYHPYVIKQTKVVSCILENMLRTQIKTFGKWDVVFPKIALECNC